MTHLREQHFNSDKTSQLELQQYIVPAQYLNDMVICMEACRLMLTMMDHLSEAIKLIDEIKQGVAGSSATTFPYRLTKSLVGAFQHFFSLMIQAVDITSYAKRNFAASTSSTAWTQLLVGRELDYLTATGVELEFALCKAGDDLIWQSHDSDYLTAGPYEAMDSPYILFSLMASLVKRSYTSDTQSLLKTYIDLADMLVSCR